jgi:4-hydroxy-tetrahydrodipicolinate synthase
MSDDGSIDFEGWRRLIRFQIEEGIDGLVPLGTTGENPTLDEAEEDRLIAILMEEVTRARTTTGRRLPVLVGAGSNDTAHAVAYTKRARDAGADAALVVTPYYNKPNDSGLIAHFRAVAAVGIPIIVYNIAGRTGRNIPTPLMQEIAGIPGIAGVKEASGDLAQISEVIEKIALPAQKAGGSFALLSGDDGLTLPIMALGGGGVISVISNIVPGKVSALVKAAAAGDWEEARRIHFSLMPLVRAAFIETNPAPIKRAMTLAGLPGGPCRRPLGPISAKSEEALRAALAAQGIIK